MADVNPIFEAGGDMGARMRAFDWSSTPLGGVETWPQSLHTALGICLASRLPIAIYWGPALTLLYNDAWSPILGAKHPSALGRPARDVWPELWETIGPLFEQVMAKGESTDPRDDVAFTPIRGEGGRVEGVFNAVVDTASPGSGERRSRVFRDLLSLLDQVPTPMSILRLPDLRYEFSNRAHVELTGQPVVGMTLQEAFPDLAERARSFDWIAATKQALVKREVATKLRWADGTERTRYFTTLMQPWIDADGTVGSVLSLSLDVTDQVTARLALDSARQEAEDASRAKDEFLAMLGHELRNPLAPMLTATQLMRMRGMNGRELAIIERQVSHLRRLVDDLLDVSRIARGKIELRKQFLEIASAVLAGIDMASPLLEHRRQELILDVPAEGLVIDADGDRIAQVVSNLVSNAAKYSEPGTKVHVAASRVGQSVRLSIRDQGIGIAPELLGRLFDSFVQQPQALDRAKGGLGLGLSIVRSLVQLHGGTVEARSDGLGMGSEFVVELPLAADAIQHEAARGGIAAEPSDRKRLLVIDDNVDAAETLAQILKSIGYTTATAHDGPSALNVARTFRPDICLLDIGLPVMDGYEVAARLRELEGLPSNLRIIAVTGYGQDTDRKRTTAAGFDGHVVKPVDLDLLLRNVVAN